MFATTRDEFTDRCLRNLGAPVIEINVDETQVADRVDDAINKYWDYHFNGVEKLYMKYQITANDVTNTFIPMASNVRGVTRILPLVGSGITGAGINMFDVRYQYMLNNLPNFTSLSYVDFEITMMHIEMINMFFNGLPGIRFNRLQNRLFLDIDWNVDILAGQWVIVDCWQVIDPDTYSAMWSDDWLFRYASALIKRQWGSNMKKFTNVMLPGGITIDGQTLYNEAVAEIAALEFELRDTYEEPPMFRMG